MRCLKQGHSCDGQRPCLNCLTLGLADDCADLKAQSTSSSTNYGSKSKRNTNLPAPEVEIKTFDPDGFVTLQTGTDSLFDINASVKVLEKLEVVAKKPVVKKAASLKKAWVAAPTRPMKKRPRRQDDEMDYEDPTDDYSSSLSESRSKRARTSPASEIPYAMQSIQSHNRGSYDYTESSAANTPLRRDSVTYHDDLLSTSDPMDEPFEEEAMKVSIFDSFDNFSNIPMDTFETSPQPVLLSSGTEDFNTTLSFMDDVFSAPLY